MNPHSESTPDAIDRLIEQTQNAIAELQNDSLSPEKEDNNNTCGRDARAPANSFSPEKEEIGNINNTASKENVTKPEFSLEELVKAVASPESAVNLDAVKDIELDVRVVLGEAELTLDEVMRLRKGSVVPLNAQSSDPVNIVVNGRVIAKGEALNRNGKFCVRLTEIYNQQEK